MKQPLSRDSFRHRRGYLGVYLQEGAPLLDALWNEGADLRTALLADALEDAGIEGTAGLELRIDPVTGDEGGGEGEGQRRLTGLVIRGGPRRFYCGGLPVLWPEDRPIDAQGVDQGPLLDLRHPRWLECLELGRPYLIHVDAWVEAVDALDRPDLDDPALSLDRGSFRTRVRARVRLGEPNRARTNLLLTVQGAYVDDRNLRYRVEPIALVERPGEAGRAASILWDDAGAAMVARVVERAAAHARKVEVSDPGPFTQGTFVRFEGPGVEPAVYEVTGRDATSISVRRHFCRAAVSLAGYDGIGLDERPTGEWVLLVEDGGDEEGPLARLRRGDRVSELPANLADQMGPGVLEQLQVASVERGVETWHDQGENRHRRVHAKVVLAPDGLVDALDPWNEAHASELAFPAHPFHACIEVAAHPEWSEGMRVRIHAERVERDGTREMYEGGATRGCGPGGDTVESYEDRRIARIVRHGQTMTVRLDQPLAFEHGRCDRVVPERLIRARRWQGHACAAKVDVVDPDFQPTEAHHEGPYEHGGSVVLPTGLSLRLSVDAREQGPALVPGDGWSFVARAGGWVEAPVFEPVDEIRRGSALLAQLTLREDGFELVDLRPVPASRAHHASLAAIADAADEIGQSMEPARQVAVIARLAHGMRAQRELIPAIHGLPQGDETASARERALHALRRALDVVADPEAPVDAELSRVAAAMVRLAGALCCAPEGHGPEEEKGRGATESPAPESAGAAKDAEAVALKAAAPESAKVAEAVAPKAVEVAASESAKVAAAPKLAEAATSESAPEIALVGDEVDVGALPTALMRPLEDVSPKQLGDMAREWPRLADVPAGAGGGSKRRRRFADSVAALLDATAVIGARATTPELDRAALQAELDALWSATYHVERIGRPIRIGAAVAYSARRAGREGGEP